MRYIGGGSLSVGLGLIGYVHSEAILAAITNLQNVGIGLIGFGFCIGSVGVVMSGFKGKSSVSDRLKNKTVGKATFEFKLLNVSNSFGPEKDMLSQTCCTDADQWHPDLVNQLAKLQSRDIEQLHTHYLTRQEEMQEQITSHKGSYQEFMSSLSPKVFVLDYTDPPPNGGPDRFAPGTDPRTRAER